MCTCTGEEERRKGKLGGQEFDFFLFGFSFSFFGFIHLLFLVSQREKKGHSECQRKRFPVCVFFLVRREEGRGVNKSR